MASPSATTGDVTLGEVGKALVFGAIGLGAQIVMETPKAVRQVRSDLVTARFIGEMAVTQGAAQMRERLSSDDAARSETNPPGGRGVANDTDEPAGAGEAADRDAGSPADEVGGLVADLAPAPEAADLPIPDYDTVPAIDVVMQLADLADDERAEIEAYEQSHRRRRTILGKLAQLRNDP